MRARVLLMTVLVLTAMAGTLAAAEPGTSGAVVLGIAPDAAVAACGNAGTVVPAGAAALYWNPAGLARHHGSEVMFTHAPWLEDMTYNYLASVHGEPGGAGTFGGSVLLLDYGAVRMTRIDGGNPVTGLGTVDANDLVLTLGYGRQYGDWDGGVAVKYIRQHLANSSASTLAVDVGAVLHATGVRGLTVGAVLQNVGGKLTFDRAGEHLPLTGKLGAAYALEQWPVVLLADCVMAKDDNIFFNLGAAWRPTEAFSLRVGYAGDNNAGNGLTAGAGFSLDDRFIVDYAYVPYGDLEGTQRITLRCRFGDTVSPPAPSLPQYRTPAGSPAMRSPQDPPVTPATGVRQTLPAAPAPDARPGAALPVQTERDRGEIEYIGGLLP